MHTIVRGAVISASIAASAWAEGLGGTYKDDQDRVGAISSPSQQSAHQSRETSLGPSIPTDGYVGRTGNVLTLDGPLSAGIAANFELRLIEAVVFAGDEMPVVIVINSRGGSRAEAERIVRALKLFRDNGTIFEARVNYNQVCGRLCQSVIASAQRRLIDPGALIQGTETDTPQAKSP